MTLEEDLKARGAALAEFYATTSFDDPPSLDDAIKATQEWADEGEGATQRAAGATAAALRQWERKALNRLKAGKTAACGFESADIPEATRAAVAAGLEASTVPSAVRRTFWEAEQAEASPVDVIADTKRRLLADIEARWHG